MLLQWQTIDHFGLILSLLISPLITLIVLIALGKNEKAKENMNVNKIEQNNDDNIDKLVELSELYEKGLLTKEEYELKKKELLNL